MTLKSKKKSPPPHAAAPSSWKPPPPTFVRASADDRLLELFHAVTSTSTHLNLLNAKLELQRDQVRAVALLAEAREVLRAVVKLGPAVPSPKKERPVGLELVPLELLQAAGDLLPQLNELLKEARR